MNLFLTYHHLVLFEYTFQYFDGGVLLVKEFTSDPSTTRLYHISCDRLGSVEKVRQSILINGAGLLNTIMGGNISFDWDNLSFIYKGGMIDKIFPTTGLFDGKPGRRDTGFGVFAMIGNSNIGEVYQHELHHLWHSRTMSNLYLANYLIQGVNSLLLKVDFIEDYNYYEDIPNYYKCW